MKNGKKDMKTQCNEHNRQLNELEGFVKRASNKELVLKNCEIKKALRKTSKSYKLAWASVLLSSALLFGGAYTCMMAAKPLVRYLALAVNLCGFAFQVFSLKKVDLLKNKLQTIDKKLDIIYDEIMDRVDITSSKQAEIFPDVLNTNEKNLKNRQEIASLLEENNYLSL